MELIYNQKLVNIGNKVCCVYSNPHIVWQQPLCNNNFSQQSQYKWKCKIPRESKVIV